MTAVSHAAAQGSVSGIAADADTGEPIAGSHIFEVIPGKAQRADILNFSGVRSRRTNAEGVFQFQADPPSITGRMWNWLSPPRTRRFHFYHPNYGLIWGREEKDGQVRIEASLRDAHRRQADAAELCGARRANCEKPFGELYARRKLRNVMRMASLVRKVLWIRKVDERASGYSVKRTGRSPQSDSTNQAPQ